MNKTAAAAVGLMAACCLLGPAVIAAAIGAAAGSWLGIGAALMLAVACATALLLWQGRDRRAC